jgi:hypothetical protein
MAHSTSISHVGDKLVVGQVDTSFLAISARVLPGTAVLNGPVYIGATLQFGVSRASCMIGPPLPGLSVPASLEVTGVTNILGSFNVIGNSLFTGPVTVSGVSIFNGAGISNSIDLKNGLDIANPLSICNSNTIINGVLICNFISSPWLDAQLAIARALPAKSFDIPHPSKPTTHRLRYVCLEGPEVGAYVRGKLIGSNIINLPDYWKDLVYSESITVNLTPIGIYQELFVEKIQRGTEIVIKNNLGSSINCDYIVYGERKTKDKLQPEYEGTSPNDYPGRNEEYSLAGWNYDRR